MKIGITGASGFVGRNLCNYLKDDYKLKTMNIRYKFNQNFNIDENVIIHLAGKAHDLKKVSKPEDYYNANFELTKQVYDAFLISKASVFIFMSTVKAAADKVYTELTEECVPNPQTHYGIAKHQAEEYILSQAIPNNKRVYILRPCMIHGPGNKGNLNLLYQIVSKGIPWPLGAFENRRSFLSIENLCFVIKELLDNAAIPSGVYQVADDEALSTNELIKLLGTSLDKTTRIWKIPIYSAKIISRLGDFLSLPLNSERLEKLTENYVVSNEKIKKAISKELPVSTKEGLILTFRSFSNNR